ncbi:MULTISPECIES: NAD(P)/FAD-dependent oxidoreductase [Methylobacterium]|uniref:FAD-dependent oxidoreductase n=1 Tax=Methylobacterium longum TaxID=767694 RepID=A0ABT8AY13_9HYPH|nr:MULTISPECIES: FAD-dependent oxidoreductase [Methylobacterium]MCJ2102671.1 FAD-dependent oxidoreductase [Methylobacterium sp. E-046]MDN3574450.1 FAD-dependent oxidoreductase [Methylobacterium longum]GJE10249.1 Ferredoxin--NAD(P)(+) reductase fdr [Methylobacterium longum]
MAQTPLRAVIVGAGLAALRGAEALREAGFTGTLTIVGDEPCRPYDRPPLSKHVLAGAIPADATTLPGSLGLDADWQLGNAATGLDRESRTVRLADGGTLPYDRLLIATGTRARPWPNPHEGRLAGVFTLRGRDDAAALRRALAAGPKRVLVIGGGFIGCEVASLCRQLGLPVTLVEPGPTLLARVLGSTIGAFIGAIHEGHGVDLRCGREVEWLEGAEGRLVRAHLVDGARIDADVAVIALGAVRNTAWLDGSGLSADPGGVDCDAEGHVLDAAGRPDPCIAAAGDVARFPHPLYDGQRVALEHWSHAVAQGLYAGRLLAGAAPGRTYGALPTFWSTQGDLVVKSAGLTQGADAVAITQGDPAAGRFVALYGRAGRCIAAVSVDAARWLPAHAELVAAGAPFPPRGTATDRPKGVAVVAPGFP